MLYTETPWNNITGKQIKVNLRKFDRINQQILGWFDVILSVNGSTSNICCNISKSIELPPTILLLPVTKKDSTKYWQQRSKTQKAK
jgi:hypothetical protein